MLPDVHAIWIGNKLGPLSVACLLSFVRTGHRVTLHSYETVTDLPRGVIASDAERLFPKARVRRHVGTRSYAPISDLIRLEIQHQELGLYVDCDMYCLRPMEDEDVILGHTGMTGIGNSLMKLPRGPVLDQLRAMGAARGWIPPFGSRKRRWLLRGMQLIGQWPDATRLPSGWVGPMALTHFVQRSDLRNRVKPVDVFFPVAEQQQFLFVDPELCIEDLVTPRTHYIHVYHQDLKLDHIPPSSPLGEMMAQAI